MGQQFLVEVPAPPKSKYPSNYVSTTKYNIFTFLPFSLILQFRRYANIYFLVCAIMQSIPLISPLSPFSAISPLVFVLTLSMMREGYEDYKRYKSDQQNNSSLTKVFKENQFVETKWAKVHTSDFIEIQKDQIIPADIIPLICSNSTGISYVETSSLDGEKNLKPKISLPQTQLSYNNTQSLPNFKQISAKIYCDSPNPDINKFNGKIIFETKGINFESKINQKNLLLRGCKLKNTDFVIGVTVYTGDNTKLIQNGASATSKTSNIERKVNNIILVILVFQVLCSLGSAIDCYFECVANINFQNFLLQSTSSPCVSIAAISFGSYFILYSTFIPISLIVSLQFVKLFQGFVMSSDQQMHSKENDRKLQCHTVSINEQLGQIQYILTDKTGTLTCNKMQFRNVVIGNSVYGQDIKLPQFGKGFDFSRITRKFTMKNLNQLSPQENSKPSFDSRKISYDLHQTSQQSHRAQIQLMFFMISTCHECLKQKDTYQGPSPDQVALLKAAKNIGFQFVQTQNKVTTVLHNQKQYKFQILKIIEFDSDRKRMSVIVKYDGVKRIFCKGADSSIEPLLKKGMPNLFFMKQKTKQMAKTGLRALWFAQRSLPYQLNVQQAKDEQLQTQLNLIGATAIQDKLQDFVPQTIYSLREGGIKFIMLTGDKLQTADNIARSCKLIDDGFLINSKAKLVQRLQAIKFDPPGNKISPVIDGSTLNFQDTQSQLLQVIQKSNSAVFCRVTPNQKAQIVKIVKKLGKLTLAIGDGANDVNMILQAHVGVGIFGQEGTRAAQVSNYAIGQFCILWKLLLYYGRLNYMRISQMILYFFYKNMVFTIVQFAYSFYTLSSGQSFWLSWSITFYNMVFTFFPVVLRAIFQVDLGISKSKNTFKELSQGNHQQQVLHSYYPKMYVISQKNQLFTGLIFFSWFFLGICQGIICLMITLYAIGGLDDSSGQNSYQTGLFMCQISAYTSVIVVVTVKLALNVKTWNFILFISFIVPSLGAYALYCYLSDIIQIAQVSTYTGELLKMPTFYACQIICVLGMFSFDCFLFAIQATKNNFHNYLKYRALQGKKLSETNLKQYWLQVQMESKR